jgi:hypothetical protein
MLLDECGIDATQDVEIASQQEEELAVCAAMGYWFVVPFLHSLDPINTTVDGVIFFFKAASDFDGTAKKPTPNPRTLYGAEHRGRRAEIS